MDEFLTRIENKEAEIRNKLFNKPFSDEQVNTAFDNINKAPFPLYIDNEDYNKFLMCLNSTNLGDEGIPFNGKVDHLSRQMSETCVMHASINALMQNKKGRHLVNRLFKLDEKGNTLKTCLPEAIKSGYNDANIHDARSAVFLSIRSSFGDGDLAALILNSIFYSMINQTGMDYIFRGFEALSGERAQIYFPDETIPDGVGLVNARQGNLLTFYKNLEIMLDEGAGAAVCTLNGERMGNYITDLETETKTKKKVFSSNQHAYSIVKMTDDYVYMQESNEPTLFIKLGKYQFLRDLRDVSTWKYN